MPFKVSVCLITYNQEKYIAQAIESVLMQKTSFDIELVIGDDCSTDRTQEIIASYWEKNPKVIRPILRRANIGMHGNLLSTLKECTGDYIALLEGDDYWLSPSKLEIQAQFLDDHPSFVQCYHKCKIADGESSPNENLILERTPKKEVDLAALLSRNIMPTCSVVFRNGLIDNYPEWINRYWFLDWILHILHAEHGKSAYLDDCYGVYRIHEAGLTGKTNVIRQYRDIIDFQSNLKEYLEHKYDDILDRAITANKFTLAKELLRDGEIDQAKEVLNGCLLQGLINPEIPKIELFRLFLQSWRLS